MSNLKTIEQQLQAISPKTYKFEFARKYGNDYTDMELALLWSGATTSDKFEKQLSAFLTYKQQS